MQDSSGLMLLAGTNAARRQVAREAGIEDVFDPAVDPVADGSIDLVIDAVGSAASRAQASRAVRLGGVIVHVGLLPGNEGLDIRRLTLGEIIFTGSFCYNWADFHETVDLLARGGLGPLNWVQERPMQDGAAAFQALDSGSVAAAKIVLQNPLK